MFQTHPGMPKVMPNSEWVLSQGCYEAGFLHVVSHALKLKHSIILSGLVRRLKVIHKIHQYLYECAKV